MAAQSVVARIVSLLPSSTEIACALGAGKDLVGRSHECDFPSSIAGLPTLTAPRIDTHAPSLRIDQDVKRLVEEGLSIYRVDAEQLRGLAPDVILTQTLCKVCAVTPEDLEDALGHWTGRAPRIVSLEATHLDGVFEDILRVGRALELEERGRALVAELRERISALRERATKPTRSPRVACIEWIDPLMAAGNWMPELVELAGGRNLFGRAGEHSPWLTWETLREAEPDVIAVLPCGFSIERTRAEMQPLSDAPGFAELAAVREGRVYLLEGNQYFNRPGPRLVDSLEILCELLHPELFEPTHRGEGWVPL